MKTIICLMAVLALSACSPNEPEPRQSGLSAGQFAAIATIARSDLENAEKEAMYSAILPGFAENLAGIRERRLWREAYRANFFICGEISSDPEACGAENRLELCDPPSPSAFRLSGGRYVEITYDGRGGVITDDPSVCQRDNRPDYVRNPYQ